jgi:hypothetical protein
VFSLDNDFYVMDDVTFNGTAVVPEPGTLTLLGAGLIAALRRYRKRSAAPIA